MGPCLINYKKANKILIMIDNGELSSNNRPEEDFRMLGNGSAPEYLMPENWPD